MSILEPGPATVSGSSSRAESRRSLASRAGVIAGLLAFALIAAACSDDTVEPDEMLLQLLEDDRALDGSGNNLSEPTRGAAGQPFTRMSAAAYVDGISEIDADRPAERYLSNRVFNDTNVDLFSENGISHWGFVWGQFIDHTISLSESGGDGDDIPTNDFGLPGIIAMTWDADDPLEMSPNAQGIAHTFRSAVVEGTGADTGVTAEQINKLNSYIDAFNVYGGTAERLDWLREGSADGDPANNSAILLMEDGYLHLPEGVGMIAELKPEVFERPDATVRRTE